jgi:hypothetical protein
METVFISSLMVGLEEIRQAAREAVQSVGMLPIMAELSGASSASAQRALLDDVARADIYLLILGERYGNPGASGLSPTDEEFEEAQRRRKPILVMRQDVAMEPRQRKLLERAGGRWEEGQKWDAFTDERDIGLKIVRALTRLQQMGNARELAPQAQQRAHALAHGEQQVGYRGYGSRARVALVPLVDVPLLDEVALEVQGLPDRLAELARSSRVVPQSLGIEQNVSHAGITLSAASNRRGDTGVTIEVGTDGAILVEGSVAGDDPNFGSSRVDPERLQTLVTATTDYAVAVWHEVDARNNVQQVAAAIGIPDANGKVFGRPSRQSNSLSFGSSMSLPQVIVAPDPATVVRRVDLPAAETRQRLVAGVKRVFADANALETA